MTDETKRMWMERFARRKVGPQPSKEEEEAWSSEYDALSGEDRAALQAELDRIHERSSEIVEQMVDMCDITAGDAVRQWEQTKPAMDVESASFILLYRLVSGHNHHVAILPTMVHETMMAARSLLAGDAENRGLLSSINAKLETVIEQQADANKINQRIVDGLIELYKLQRESKK